MKQKLKLDRPLAVFDLETTGTSPGIDRIIDIAILKINSDGTKTTFYRRVNPGMPIPPEASEVHGIYDKDVESKPPFEEVAGSVVEFLEGCDLGGYNILKFDLPLLQEEFKRVGAEFSSKDRHVIDPLRIFQAREPRTLEGAYRFYCEVELKEAHSAEVDTQACWEVVQAQLDRYSDLPRNLPALHDYCQPHDDHYVDSDRKFKWRYRQAAFAFSQHQGVLLKDVAEQDPSFLRWILSKDFTEETKQIVKDALRGKFPKK